MSRVENKIFKKVAEPKIQEELPPKYTIISLHDPVANKESNTTLRKIPCFTTNVSCWKQSI